MVLGDTITRKVGIVRKDSITLSDAFARSVTHFLTLSEAVVLVDSRFTRVSKYLSETSRLIETFCKSIYKAFADPVALQDSYGRVVYYYRTLSEEIALSGTIGRKTCKIIKDTLVLRGVLGKSVSKRLAEAISLVDSVGKSPRFYRVFSEAIGLTDTLSKQASRVLTEALSLIEAFGKTIVKYFTESTSVSEVFSRTFIKVLAVTDLVYVSDSLAYTTTFAKILEDSMRLQDAFRRAVWLSRRDSIVLADIVAKGVSKTITNVALLSDLFARKPTKSLEEAISLVDTSSASVTKALVDSIVLAGVVVKRPRRFIGDSVSVGDVFARKPILVKEEFLSLADSFAKSVSKALVDNIVLSGILQTVAYHFLYFEDMLTASDSVVKKPVKGLGDAVSFIDSMATYRYYYLHLIEYLSINEVWRRRSLMFEDTIGLQDSILVIVPVIELPQYVLEALKSHPTQRLYDRITDYQIVVGKLRSVKKDDWVLAEDTNTIREALSKLLDWMDEAGKEDGLLRSLIEENIRENRALLDALAIRYSGDIIIPEDHNIPRMVLIRIHDGLWYWFGDLPTRLSAEFIPVRKYDDVIDPEDYNSKVRILRELGKTIQKLGGVIIVVVE